MPKELLERILLETSITKRKNCRTEHPKFFFFFSTKTEKQDINVYLQEFPFDEALGLTCESWFLLKFCISSKLNPGLTSLLSVSGMEGGSTGGGGGGGGGGSIKKKTAIHP